jgi:AraC-like DNA-binding protein
MRRLPARSDTAIWRDDTLAHAEWLRGSYRDFAYAPHAHDAECLAVITAGRLRIRAAGQEFIARAGDMFAAPAGLLHAGWPIDDDGWSLRTVYLDLSRLQALVAGEDTAFPGSLAGPHLQDPELAARFIAAHESSERRAPALLRDETLLAFADRLFRRHLRPVRLRDGADAAPDAVRRAREFLDAHVDTRVSLQDLARIGGLPPWQLLRAFARAVGQSPHAYQRQVRLQRATALIRRGHPIGDAAVSAGFADQAHFTRLFRRTMGLSPGAYRRGLADQRADRGALRVAGQPGRAC